MVNKSKIYLTFNQIVALVIFSTVFILIATLVIYMHTSDVRMVGGIYYQRNPLHSPAFLVSYIAILIVSDGILLWQAKRAIDKRNNQSNHSAIE